MSGKRGKAERKKSRDYDNTSEERIAESYSTQTNEHSQKVVVRQLFWSPYRPILISFCSSANTAETYRYFLNTFDVVVCPCVFRYGQKRPKSAFCPLERYNVKICDMIAEVSSLNYSSLSSFNLHTFFLRHLVERCVKARLLLSLFLLC